MRQLYFRHEIEAMYEELMNDAYEPYKIGDCYYEAGTILKNTDPIAFACGVNDWESGHCVEVVYEDMSDDEVEHYIVSDHQVMYFIKDET